MVKLSYEILLRLDEETIEDGLEVIYTNARDLSNAADILATKKKYPLATALKLLTIEELIKAQSLFFFLIGVRDKEFIDYGFKKVKGYKNIHETRLHIASAFNHIHRNLKKIDFDGKINSFILTEKDNLQIREGESIENYIKRIGQTMANATQTAEIQSKLGPKTPSKTIIEKKDWLSNAQQIKEHCFYVDIDGTNWSYPREIKRKEYLNAKKHTEESFLGVTRVISKYLKEGKVKRPYMLLTLKSTILPLLEKGKK